MKNKVILLTFIFVLSSAFSPTHAANSQQKNAKNIALFLEFAKKNPNSVDAVKEVLQQNPLLQSPDQKQISPAQTTLAKAAQKISPADSAKAKLAEIAEQISQIDLSSELDVLRTQKFFNQLGEAATQAEIIRDSYSYFNLNRYILSNKISYLKKLQEKAKDKADNEKYQQEVKKTLKALISWLG